MAIDENAEDPSVRQFFVSHEGKKTLTVEVGPSIYGVDYEWFFQQMTGQISESINNPDYTQIMETDFSSSTPVRASFRRNRPQTMICLEENSQPQPTPVKRESRTRLKEIKSRRRWSSMEHPGPSSTSSPSPGAALTGASPALRNRTPKSVTSASGVADISPVAARQVENSVEESHCGDGTETRLMLESFLEVSDHLGKNNSTLAASTIFPTNSLLLAGIANDTIIEHENKSNEVPEGPASLNSSRTQADPVIKWWMELFMSTEPECMTYLQSKPILKSKEPVSPPSTPLAFYPYEMIKTTLVAKRAVLVTFSMLKR